MLLLATRSTIVERGRSLLKYDAMKKSNIDLLRSHFSPSVSTAVGSKELIEGRQLRLNVAPGLRPKPERWGVAGRAESTFILRSQQGHVSYQLLIVCLVSLPSLIIMSLLFAATFLVCKSLIRIDQFDQFDQFDRFDRDGCLCCSCFFGSCLSLNLQMGLSLSFRLHLLQRCRPFLLLLLLLMTRTRC